MSYSVNLLKTAAECDALFAIINKEKEDLLFRKTALERQKISYSSSSDEIDKDIAATGLEIGSLQTAVAGLPPGAARDQNEARLKRLELKQFLLNQKGQKLRRYYPTYQGVRPGIKCKANRSNRCFSGSYNTKKSGFIKSKLVMNVLNLRPSPQVFYVVS